jgi:lipoprotein-anchoring transpeptidase ErfK/SrfK
MMDAMTSAPRPRRTIAALAGLLLLSAAAGACTRTGTGQPPAALTSPTPVAVPTLVPGDGSGTARWDAPLTVTAHAGTLRAVALVDPRGELVSGHLDGGTWTSTGDLVPGATYRVMGRVTDGGGSTRTLDAQVRTTDATRTVHATLSPAGDRVVGIGLPAIVTLDRSVTDPDDRAALEGRLQVTTDPVSPGAWRWMSSKELHYRGPAYWTKGTRITVRSDLTGLKLHDGVWGEGIRETTFSIGSAVIATVDVQKLTMAVTVDGALVRTVKVSTGRDKYPTKGGVHLVLEKVKVEVMDSATVGIPRNSPDGYFEKVPNSVRISYGGAFVHSASWSVRDQGVRNVSHGCVNISPADAAWFFDLVKRGDIVDIRNAKAPPLLSDPGMSDWNIPYSQWAS